MTVVAPQRAVQISHGLTLGRSAAVNCRSLNSYRLVR